MALFCTVILVEGSLRWPHYYEWGEFYSRRISVNSSIRIWLVSVGPTKCTTFSCITLISSQKLYHLFFCVKTEVTCSEPFKARKVFLLLIACYVKLTAWKNSKNALVLTLSTCSWGSWDSGNDMWLVWGHADGDMERLPLVLLQTPRCLSATSAHRRCCRESLLHGQGPQMHGPSFLPFSLSPPFLMRVLRWMVLVLLCFWLKTHFVCVCAWYASPNYPIPLFPVY